MKTAMMSRERILGTLRREPVDHLPLCFDGIFHGSLYFVNTMHPDPRARAAFLLSLGLDTALECSPPVSESKAYRVREWIEMPDGARYPRMYKEYITPAGLLRQVVNRTDDYGMYRVDTSPQESIALFSDHNVPPGRSVEYLVSGEKDLDKLPYILCPPSGKALDAYRRRAAELKRFCQKHGILLAGRLLGVGDPLCWMSGVEPLIMMAVDQPDVLHRYIEIVSRWNRRRLNLMLDAGVDIIVRRAWYESADFWSPKLFRAFFFDPLKEEIETTQRAGATFTYVMNSGSLPLLTYFRELKPDIYSNIDPDKLDAPRIKREIGDVVTLCGGVNSYRVLEQGSESEVRAAVRGAIDRLAPDGGYILAPDNVVRDFGTVTRRNIHTMIDVWKEAC